MSATLETINVITTTGIREMASFSFDGYRTDIWHRLGQQFTDDRRMTAEEAMVHANMDRELRIVDFPDVEGIDHWSITRPQVVVLEGKVGVTDDGHLFEIPDKVVGLAGEQAAAGHLGLSMRDRFDLAEEAADDSREQA